jgi:hypothetical protein
MPDRDELASVCYVYRSGSYDAQGLALLQRRVVRFGTVDCRSCVSVLRQYPQLWAQWTKRSAEEQRRVTMEGAKAVVEAIDAATANKG